MHTQRPDSKTYSQTLPKLRRMNAFYEECGLVLTGLCTETWGAVVSSSLDVL